MTPTATHERQSLNNGETFLAPDAPPFTIPFGLFELDAAGTVIRYSPPSEQKTAEQANDIWGRNFFTEVAPAEQVAEFRARFHAFMADGLSVERFSTTFAHGGQNVKVQIMMAHITERTEGKQKRLALVRIMPE